MAEPTPSLEQTQTEVRTELRNIVEVLRQANNKEDESNDTIKEVVEEQRKTRSDLGGHHNWSKKHMLSVQSYYNWSKKFTERAAKAAKAMASKLDPSAFLKSAGDKIKAFAGDILKLLLTGGILLGLSMLFKWLAEQDPTALYNTAKAAWDKFTEGYEGWIAGFSSLAGIVVGWKTAEFLTAGKGPLWALWNATKAIFAAGGLILGLADKVLTWSSNIMFGDDKTSPLRKLWKLITGIFGAGGKIIGMVTWFTGATVVNFFDVVTSDLAQLWKIITGIFGPEGKINKLFSVASEWTKTQMFDEAGDLRQLWSKVTGIFGPNGKLGGIRKFFDALGDVMMFDESGDLRKLWKWTGGIFGAEGKIASAYKVLSAGVVDWFDEQKDLRKLFTFLKNIFGAEGKIAKGLNAILDAEDFVGGSSDLRAVFNFLKSFFGAEGKIATGFKAIKTGLGVYFGPESSLGKVFSGIDNLFGPESSPAKFNTTIGEYLTKFKNFFSFAPDAKEGNAISKFFGKISGFFSSIGGLVTKIADNKIVKGALSFIKAGGSFIARIFAPIGWIMGFVEAVTGFWDGFKDKGEGDNRSMFAKLMDGLKGAISGLIDFIVIDTVVLLQDILNWAIGKYNALAKKVPFLDEKETFTFGDDLGKASQEFIQGLGGDSGFGAGKEVIPRMEEKETAAPVQNPLLMNQDTTNNNNQTRVLVSKKSEDPNKTAIAGADQ